jgi:hypothetical protein
MAINPPRIRINGNIPLFFLPWSVFESYSFVFMTGSFFVDPGIKETASKYKIWQKLQSPEE